MDAIRNRLACLELFSIVENSSLGRLMVGKDPFSFLVSVTLLLFVVVGVYFHDFRVSKAKNFVEGSAHGL